MTTRSELPFAPIGGRLEPGRLRADPENVEKGLAQLVLQLVELLRYVMENQAVRRMECGDLSDEQLERLGQTLMLLDQRMTELCDHFGLTREELVINLDLLGSWGS